MLNIIALSDFFIAYNYFYLNLFNILIFMMSDITYFIILNIKIKN